MKRESFFLVIVFFTMVDINSLFAQSIRGAEIVKSILDQELIINVLVYREGDSKDSILVFWGDGNQEFVPLSVTSIYSSDFRIDKYYKSHLYDTIGYVEVGFTDGYLVDGVINIENSWQKEIYMKDSIYIFPEGHGFSNNSCPEFAGSQYAINLVNGKVTHWAFLINNDPFGIDNYEYSIVTFPMNTNGYSFPEATNSMYMDNAFMIWDRPVVPGTYAICIKVRELRQDYYDDFPGDSILMSSTHRAMMIDIDSSMLVSTVDPLIKGFVSVFPNPAKDVINLQLSIFNTPSYVRIFDVNGREMYHTKTQSSSQVETMEVQVKDWPRGVYFVHIDLPESQIVRKVLLD